MKKLRIIVAIVIAIIIGIIVLVVFSIKKSYENIIIERLSKELTDFYNEGKMSEHICKGGKEWYKFYVKSDRRNYYDITDFVEDYIDKVEKCFEAKDTNNTNVFRGYNRYKSYSYDTKIPIVITGIDTSNYFIKYVINAIPEEDIEEYRKGHYREMMVDRLSKVLEYKNNHWYLESYDDKIFELPYNTYIDYKSGHEKAIKEIKHVNSMKIVRNEIKNLGKERKSIRFVMNYNDYNDINQEKKVSIHCDCENGNYIFDVSSIEQYYVQRNGEAYINIGSHDWDRQREENMRTVPNFSTAELNRADEIWARVNKKMEVESALPEEEHTGFWKWLDEFNKNKSSFSEAEKETALDLLAQKSDEMRESMFAEEESIYESELAEANEK